MKQPVSVGVDASSIVFQSYRSGILSSPNCGTDIDHMMLAVGWGMDSNNEQFYILKNTWGATWGENGYMRILANGKGKGICGVQTIPSYGVAN